MISYFSETGSRCLIDHKSPPLVKEHPVYEINNEPNHNISNQQYLGYDAQHIDVVGGPIGKVGPYDVAMLRILDGIGVEIAIDDTDSEYDILD